MPAPNCLATKSLIAGSSCDQDSAPGIQEVTLINKSSIIAASIGYSACGYVNGFTLCNYCCALTFRPELDTGSAESAWTRQGNTMVANAAFEGTYVLKTCTDVAALEEFRNAELVGIILDSGGNYWIGGHVPSLKGFRLESFTWNTGKAATDTITSTIRWSFNNPAGRGSLKLFLLGDDSMTFEVRSALTADFMKRISCTPGSTTDCGCTPGE